MNDENKRLKSFRITPNPRAEGYKKLSLRRQAG